MPQGLLVASRQTTDFAEQGQPRGMPCQYAGPDIFSERLFQQRIPLHDVPLKRRGITQTRREPGHHGSVPRVPTEGQPLLQSQAGRRQVALGEMEKAQVGVGNNRRDPSPDQCGEAHGLLSVAPAFAEGSEGAQGPRQPRPGLDPHGGAEPVRLLVCHLYVLPQQRGRPPEVADGIVDLPQVMGCVHL